MGVPSFYRWLVNKYPKIVANAIEEQGDHDGIDTSLPNPNGFEFDNLYLDMNGIIHPCFHPEDDNDSISPPRTFEDVFSNMFRYMDRIFGIIRPRKLLYMAIDGVAPRAKMNQQRGRRFRTAKDKELEEEEESRVMKEFEGEGKLILPREDSETSDSNIITPGTEFMDRLSKALKSFISSRLDSDRGWKNVKVILSDSNVPGEGEHKIMSFIRSQRTQPSYDPNTRHCLYGLDADLIMLALATHEIHFSILREDMLAQEQNDSSMKSREWFKNSLRPEENKGSIVPRKPYQLLHAWILREYLSLDMRIPDEPEGFKFDLERIIDDFIFMCFFVGNDFLPHTPSLSIHEKAIDLLMSVYKKEMKTIGGYLVDMTRVDDKKGSYIKLSRVEKFILSVSAYEDRIFNKRARMIERKLRHICSEPANEDEDGLSDLVMQKQGQKESVVPTQSLACEDQDTKYAEKLKNTKELKHKVKHNLRRKSDLYRSLGSGNDKVRLGTPGFKERYYKEKFGAAEPGEIESTRKKIVVKYTEGLLWVLQYYFAGPPSWTWHYPYYHGPLLSELKGLSQTKVRFQKDLPFKPFDQLLSVLPPRSVCALPKAYQALMDEDSPIIDFYPEDFTVDMDGKRFAWQGVCKLPFIDEIRLLTETKKLESDLETEELDRNTEKLDQLLLRCTHNIAITIEQNGIKNREKLILKSNEIFGSVQRFDTVGDQEIFSSIQRFDTVGDQEDSVLCVRFEVPAYSTHLPRTLQGVNYPETTIKEDDIEETPLWHEYYGNKPPYKHGNIEERFRGSCRMESSRESFGRGRGIRRGFSMENSSSYKRGVRGGGSRWSRGRGQPSRDAYYNPSKEWTGNRSSHDPTYRDTRGQPSREAYYNNPSNNRTWNRDYRDVPHEGRSEGFKSRGLLQQPQEQPDMESRLYVPYEGRSEGFKASDRGQKGDRM